MYPEGFESEPWGGFEYPVASAEKKEKKEEEEEKENNFFLSYEEWTITGYTYGDYWM